MRHHPEAVGLSILLPLLSLQGPPLGLSILGLQEWAVKGLTAPVRRAGSMVMTAI